jgi:uncharacterized protein (TIGR02284 family)
VASDTINTLNKLIETSKDGEFGFRDAAEKAVSPDLKQTLQRRAEQCHEGAVELQALVVQLGGHAEDGGTVAGAAHRGWMAVKGSLTGNTDLAILEECERGEDVAMKHYREALDSGLPATAQAVVERQYLGVKHNHAQVRALREQARASAH